jgi:hypothetical protein
VDVAHGGGKLVFDTERVCWDEVGVDMGLIGEKALRVTVTGFLVF